MADAKISQLTALTTAADDDLLAIVDTSATETKKIAKSDLVAGLQAELVSGTNIKTINSTSLLGSGDISVSASPAGTAGQIQFSDGSAFAADSNLYWDNTNKRLGVGTATPGGVIEIKAPTALYTDTAFKITNSAADTTLSITNRGDYTIGSASGGGTLKASVNGIAFNIGNATKSEFRSTFQWWNVDGGFGINTTPTARLQVKGSGSTSASTSLLVQNSSGTELLKVQDDGQVTLGGFGFKGGIITGNAYFAQVVYGPSFYIQAGGSATFGAGGSADATAILEARSTTKGFLPPRMTTTQKNAISTPAAGLQLYDSTTSRPCVYTTAWESLTSSDSASPTAVYKFWSGTAAQYAALTPDANTVYFVS